ncbi:hypothetical protein ES703_111604 [subsurface metagenome]
MEEPAARLPPVVSKPQGERLPHRPILRFLQMAPPLMKETGPLTHRPRLLPNTVSFSIPFTLNETLLLQPYTGSKALQAMRGNPNDEKTFNRQGGCN